MGAKGSLRPLSVLTLATPAAQPTATAPALAPTPHDPPITPPIGRAAGSREADDYVKHPFDHYECATGAPVTGRRLTRLERGATSEERGSVTGCLLKETAGRPASFSRPPRPRETESPLVDTIC